MLTASHIPHFDHLPVGYREQAEALLNADNVTSAHVIGHIDTLRRTAEAMELAVSPTARTSSLGISALADYLAGVADAMRKREDAAAAISGAAGYPSWCRVAPARLGEILAPLSPHPFSPVDGFGAQCFAVTVFGDPVNVADALQTIYARCADPAEAAAVRAQLYYERARDATILTWPDVPFVAPEADASPVAAAAPDYPDFSTVGQKIGFAAPPWTVFLAGMLAGVLVYCAAGIWL